jgi:hypothetical protein
MEYDSRADTLKHSLLVGELMGEVISELVYRSTQHDLSKTREPELSMLNAFVPKLSAVEFGSEEYRQILVEMGSGLQHHYEVNRHHPEHFPQGISDMNLVDLIEMLADWKAETERGGKDALGESIAILKDRFEISDQLCQILRNTAEDFGWLR